MWVVCSLVWLVVILTVFLVLLNPYSPCVNKHNKVCIICSIAFACVSRGSSVLVFVDMFWLLHIVQFIPYSCCTQRHGMRAFCHIWQLKIWNPFSLCLLFASRFAERPWVPWNSMKFYLQYTNKRQITYTTFKLIHIFIWIYDLNVWNGSLFSSKQGFAVGCPSANSFHWHAIATTHSLTHPKQDAIVVEVVGGAMILIEIQ